MEPSGESATADTSGALRANATTRGFEERRAALQRTGEFPVTGMRLLSFLVRPRPPATRYALALATTLVAGLVTVFFAPHLGRVVFVIFWPAVLVSALAGGLGPATMSSVLAIFIVHRFLISPNSAGPLDARDIGPLAAFLIASLGMSSVANALRRARAQSAGAASELNTLALELEEQAVELEQQLEESQSLQEELEQTTEELADRTQDAEAAGAFSRGIVVSIADPFVVHDENWRFVYINEAASEIFRRSAHGSAESLIGLTLWDAYPDIVGTEHEREMRRAATERMPVSYEAFYAQAGTWSVMSCYPMPNGGLATQWRDVTARRRAEEDARYLARVSEVLGGSLEYETTLAELARIVVPELAEWCTVHVVGADGTPRQVALAHADPERVRWAEEIGRRFPPDADAPRGIPQVLRTGEPELYSEISEELIAAGARDDEHRGMLLALGLRSAMIVPLVAHGRVLGALSLLSGRSGRRYGESDLQLAREIARRASLAVDNALVHRAERAARLAADEANAAKMQFLAVMSHELRTPLNAIGGYSELMRLGLRGPVTDAQLQDLERIGASQRNLLALINDILNFAKVEAGHVEVRMADVPVAPLVRDLESLVAPQLRNGALVLHGAQCDDTLAVRGDAEKVRQILLNLLGNAIKFTPAGGTIAVRCARLDGVVRIDVIDSGIGIAPDRLHSVFDPFVQLDRTLTSQHEGTGLGLAISRDLARLMKGDIVATSSVGHGSIFSLVLPAAGT